jgi:MFS transporter, MHS family, proline/betaine transporter
MMNPGETPMSELRLPPAEIRRTVLASVIGNGLEWFDFLVYAFFARTIAHHFFPADTPTGSLLLTFATFAVGFVVRPLGGIVLGIYADRAGRQRALALLILMMAAGTLIVGLTPGFATIGIAAPLLIVAARIIQGLSVGGEFASAAAMLVELAPPGRKMFYGSFQMASQGFALLIASLFSLTLTEAMSPAALEEWGWRIPFLAGALIGPVGFYIRRRCAESPEFEALRESGATLAGDAFLPALAGRWQAILCAFGIIAVGTALNYLWHSYTPTYVTQQLHLPLSAALMGSSVCGLVAILVYPFAGWLADRIGAYRQFFIVVTLFAFCAYPIYAYVGAAPSVERLFVSQLAATLFLGLMSGPHPGMLANLFPTGSRTTGVALSYNLAVTLFGGLAPLTVTWLISTTGDPMMPAWFQILAAVVSLVLVAATAGVWSGRVPARHLAATTGSP